MSEIPRAPRTRRWPDWVGLAARLLLGGVLLVAGIVQLGDPGGLQDRAEALGLAVPAGVWTVLVVAAPVIQMLCGLLLVLGALTRSAATVAILVLLVGMGATVWAWTRSLPGPHAAGLWSGLALACVAGWLVLRPATAFSLYGWLRSGRSREGDLHEPILQSHQRPDHHRGIAR